MITDEDLRLLKASARVDYDDEDDHLRDLLETAEEAIVCMTNRDRSELEDEETGRLKHKQLRLAVCFLAKEWFENGAVSSPGTLNPALYGWSFLVKPFIKLVRDA